MITAKQLHEISKRNANSFRHHFLDNQLDTVENIRSTIEYSVTQAASTGKTQVLIFIHKATDGYKDRWRQAFDEILAGCQIDFHEDQSVSIKW